MIDNILGSKVMVRVLRFLHLSPNRYFSFLEIERFVGAGRAGLASALIKLEYYELVYVEKKGGKRYKLKLEGPLAGHLNALFDYEKRFFQGIDPRKLNVIANFENDCLKTLDGIREIRLFGSVAKGKATEGSDLDLFVLVGKGKNTPSLKAALEEIKEKYEEKYEIQSIVMDEEEFKERKREPLVQEILKTGINIVPKS
jgi:predicted nucleotidyltransferase